MNSADNLIINAGIIVAGFKNILDYALIGSAAYLEQINDVDIALLIEGNVFEWEAENCPIPEYSRCGDYDKVADSAKWTSVRKGFTNFMITNDRQFFEDYKTATEVCKALHLTEKSDRIKVCQIVRDKKKAEEV